MSELTCAQLREQADELALGLLPGPERARALAHLDRCDACAAEFHQLSAVADGLLRLVPGREPPIDFENRTMSRLGFGGRRRWHRLRLGAAAAVIALVFALGGFAIGSAFGPASPPAQNALLSATLSTGDHPVGRVYAATSTPSWVYMTIDTRQVTGQVSCQLEQRDGRIVTIGTFDLKYGYGHWGAPSPVDPAALASARVVASDGSVLATGIFPAHG